MKERTALPTLWRMERQTKAAGYSETDSNQTLNMQNTEYPREIWKKSKGPLHEQGESCLAGLVLRKWVCVAPEDVPPVA